MVTYRTLGKSGLKVSEIGLGCWAIGGPSFSDDGFPNGWTGNDDRQSLVALHRAYELGINHWDTADVYGRGHSERLIGRVFREGVKREQIILATKIGWFKGTAAHAFESLHIRHQLEQSLRNLQTDYVDIYYFHNPLFGEDNFYLEQAVNEVQRLKQEGKIRVLGQSAYDFEKITQLIPITKAEVLQLPYNALKSPFDHPDKNIFKWADNYDLGLVLFGTYAKGLLLDKYDSKNPPQFERGDIRNTYDDFKTEFIKRLKPVLARAKKRFGEEEHILARVFNQFALSRSRNAVVIPGFKNVQQVETNAATMGKRLHPDEIEFITELFAEFKNI
jgi:myo-inositol catabolism protein IolS